MSMFSPAERPVAMMLPSRKSSTSRVVRGRRSSSISTSTGTSPSGAISSWGVIGGSTDQIDRVLAQLILRRDYPRIGLIAALIDDQVGEFMRDIDRRRFQGASDDGAASPRAGCADGRNRAARTQSKIVVADREHAVRIADAGQRELRHHHLISIRILRQDAAAVGQTDVNQLRGPGSVL